MDSSLITERTLVAGDIDPILAQLGIEPAELHHLELGGSVPGDPKDPGHLLIGPIFATAHLPRVCMQLEERGDPLLRSDGKALVYLPWRTESRDVARWRNELWPWLHISAVYRVADGRAERETLQGRSALLGECHCVGTLLACVRPSHALSPEATVAKFDHNAAGWNGRPGTPGYAHFRWMRRYVGCFASAGAGDRILDFGCGAGWVGIEAALRTPNASLAFFDPSPEMVELARDNARRAGLTDFDGRVGFGEAPPFAREGERKFDLVISSGVASFAPNVGAWLDGLCSTVLPGGALVIGDIHRESRGMRLRRRTRALLPTREMNAHTRQEIRGELEARGLEHVESASYQLTDPVPQAMHWAENHWNGWLCLPLLLINRAAAYFDRGVGSPLPDEFDSWVMQMRARRRSRGT